MALDDAGMWSTLVRTLGIVVVAYAGILWLAMVVWVAGDIQRRTDSAVMQVMAIAFAALFFLPGVLLYVALRPRETLEERAERRLEVQALAAQAATSPTCKTCYRTLREDYVRCPFCATQVGFACTNCDRVNDSNWVVCPFCGDNASGPVSTPSRQEWSAADGARRVPALVAGSPAAQANGHAAAR